VTEIAPAERAARLLTHAHNATFSTATVSLLNSQPLGAMHPTRQRGHDFVPRNIKYDSNKSHFIAHSLFTMSKFSAAVMQEVDKGCPMIRMGVSGCVSSGTGQPGLSQTKGH